MEFADFLASEEIHYVFRLSSNNYKTERKYMQTEDETVILKYSWKRLQKIRKKIPRTV